MMDFAHSPTSKAAVASSSAANKSRPFVSLCTLLGELPVRDAILDGELVCLDADGRSQFMELMRRRKNACYYAFDLLWLNGADLRQEALVERKARLRKLVRGRAGILYADHLGGGAVEIPGLLRSESGGHRHQGGPRAIQRIALLLAEGDQSKLQHRGRREMFERFRQRTPAQTVKLLLLQGASARLSTPGS